MCPSENCGCDSRVTALRLPIAGNSLYLYCPSELAPPSQQFAVCGDCPSGFTGNGMNGCTKIDECARFNADAVCDDDTVCENTMGSFTCSECPTGRVGDGRVSEGGCRDCASQPHCSLVHCTEDDSFQCLQCADAFGVIQTQRAGEGNGQCRSCAVASSDAREFTNATATAIESVLHSVEPFVIEWSNCAKER
eukprot:SAG22_NODE_2044_length_3089_cov_2.202341_3_plen_193_part_00